MLNVIRADLVKLKKSFGFKILVFLWVSFFSILLWLVYFQLLKKNWYTWFFQDILSFKESLWINFAIYIYIILWFSLLADSLFAVDKWKDLILFTKNIRVKYFISKIIILLLFSLFILLFIYLLSSLSLFLSSNIYNTDLFLKLFWENITMTFIFFLSILPLLLLFSFMNLIWMRSIFIPILILFIAFINMWFWEKIEKSGISKYFTAVNKYTLLWNYNNILTSVYNDKNNYKSLKIDSKYLNKEEIEKDKENLKTFEKMTKINEMTMNMDLYNNSAILDQYLKDKPELKTKIDNLNLLLKNDLDKIKDWDLISKYQEIYNKLWWDNKFYDLQSNIENLKNKMNFEYKVISISSVKNIFSLNTNFYVWFLHLIFLLLVWSIIIKRRQVYN